MPGRKRIPVVRTGTLECSRLLKRMASARGARDEGVRITVDAVIDEVRRGGDAALLACTKRFDGVALRKCDLRVSRDHVMARARRAPAALKRTIRGAASRIRAYHRRQTGGRQYTMKTGEGRLSRIVRPLDRVGVYVPGGYTAYASTVLMNVIPAQIAGVREIAVVTPPRGELDPAIAYVLKLLRVSEIYRVGGAQAVAALAYGTGTIRAVRKIVGPGSSYVAAAKRAVFGVVDIDCVAGPSEVAVLCDGTADPGLVALDLLSQVEHGTGDELAVCVTESARLAAKIGTCIEEEIGVSETRGVFERLPKHAIAVFVCKSRAQSIAFINDLAPEHLQIITRKPRHDLAGIRNAAAVFIGPHSPVALGDYYIGTNHVLPTGGAARYGSPLGVESFVKHMSVAEVSRRGLCEAAQHVSRFARAEGFVYHALSVERRV